MDQLWVKWDIETVRVVIEINIESIEGGLWIGRPKKRWIDGIKHPSEDNEV